MQSTLVESDELAELIVSARIEMNQMTAGERKQPGRRGDPLDDVKYRLPLGRSDDGDCLALASTKYK